MELPIGSPVTLRVMFRDTAVMLTAKVVRNETVDPMLSSLWRFKVAAVIVFKPDVTMQDAKEALEGLADRLESTDVQDFIAAYGKPVLYFP